MPEVVKNNLRQIRHELQIDTQQEMAKKLKLTVQQYNLYENQQLQPSLLRALQIAKLLKRPVEKIFKIVQE